MFKKLFENTPLKSKGDGGSLAPHNTNNNNNNNNNAHSPANEHRGSPSTARTVPVVEITSPSYDQWLSSILSTYSSITIPKLKSLWQDFTLSKTDKDKVTKLNKVLYAFIVLCEQKKIDPRNLTDVFGSNRVFSFNIARRVVKDLKDLWPKQSREQCGRLSLHYLSTQGGESCGYELLYVLEKLSAYETNLDACVEAALPSTLSRVLHLFFAIPFPSLESAASVVDRTFNVVASLTSYPAVAEELVRADALYLLFATVTLECSVHHRRMRDRMTSLMHTFVKLHMTNSISTYSSNKGIMQNLIFEMANYSNFTPDEIISLCKLMHELIKETIPHVQGLLLEDFVSAGGYTFWLHTLLRLETVPQENNNNLQPQLVDNMLDVVCDMVYTGIAPLTPSASVETSYGGGVNSSSISPASPIASATPLQPPTTPGNAAAPNAVRNIDAFTILQNYFLQSSQSSCRVKVLDRLLSVYAVNPINFLLVQHLHTLAHFIEDFESYTIEVKEAILRVVLFVVTVVNCVPFQELSSLSCLLQDNPSSSTLMLIYHTISKLVNFDHRYKNILRESGLLDMLVKLLKRGYDQIRQNPADAMPASNANKLPLDAYAIVIDSLSVLTENLRENLNILRDWGCMEWLLEMVVHPTTRPAALRLVLHSIKLDTSVENSHGDLASLVRLLQVSPKTQCVLKKDILNTIRRAFTMAKITKDLFRETGGFVSLVSVLVGFEGDFTQDKDMSEPMQLLEAVFRTITSAISQHPANRLFFEEQIGYATLTSAITMMGVLGTAYAAHVIDCLFDIAFDTTSPISSSASSFLSTTSNYSTIRTAPWEAHYERAQILNRDAISVILEILPISASLDLHLEVTRKMNVLAMASRHNREALTKLGIPHLILTRFQGILSENFESPAVVVELEGDTNGESKKDDIETRKRKELQKQLLLLLQTVGANSLTAAELQEFFKLLQPANSPPILLRTLSLMSNAGYHPSYIEFSNYKHGNGFIHFPSIGDRSWAPANGYTVIFWMFIEKSAEENPVMDLFTIGTEDKKTHMSAHLRGGTFVVNASYGGSNRLEFPHAKIDQEGRWYHVALVHTRGRFRRLQGGSEMKVYVDGFLKGTQKVHYMSNSTSGANNNVGVWIGLTERIVDQRGDHRASRAIIALDQIWRLGPAYLIEEPFSSTQVNTVYNLGPTYHANFQGKFAPYQVFEVITSENIEAVKQLTEYGTQMGSLILDNASFTVPEGNIIFAFNASNSQEDINESIINAADLSGTSKGKLIGGVEAVNRSTVATSISTVGGVSVVFLLIEKAETSEALCQALQILSGIIKYNYKNTAEMDSIKGYLVVSLLLKRKAHIINEEIAELLFELSGATPSNCDGLREWSTPQQAALALINHRTPRVPVISNNHVMKHILLYYEIWKGTTVELQQSVLQKLATLFVENPQAGFNAYFMRKVHAINELFYLMKDDSLPEDVYPYIIDVVEGIWKERTTDEDIKMITHFLIGVLYSPENKKAMIYKREQELSTRSIRVCNMVLEMLLRLILSAPNKNVFYKVITTNWIFCFIDEILPASTVNLTLRIFTALAQHKPAFYTRFKKDGGIRLLERILPAFCVHASVFHTLLYLLLGKPVAPTIAPIQFEFLELFHHFKHNETSNAHHEIKAVEAAHLLLAMAKRSYEESQVQAAAGILSLSSSTTDLTAAEQLAMTGGNTINVSGGVSPSFAAVLASAHPPPASGAREPQTPSAASATANTVFSLVGSFINKVEQSVGREGSREFSGENFIPIPEAGSPPLHRKKSSMLNLGGSWRPTSPASGTTTPQPGTPPFTHHARNSSSGMPSLSSSSSSTSSTSSTPSSSAPPTPTLSHSSSTHSISSSTPAPAQRPHKVQQSLLKFMMYLFDSSHDFQTACTQLEFMERLIAIAFPNGSLAVGDGSEDDTMKIDDTVSLVFQFVTLIIDVSLKTSTRASSVVELGLEATPLSVTERQLSQYHGKLLKDVMTTLLQSFSRADFLEADRDRLPANLGRFCHLLVDRCRTNLFPNGARPVFRFLVRLLEKLEGEQANLYTPSHMQPTQHSYSSAGTEVRSHPHPSHSSSHSHSHSHGHHSSSHSRSRDGSSATSDLVPIFKALNRTILLLLGNTSYGSEPDLVLTFNAIIRNQRIVFSPLNLDHDFIFSLCYQLYKYLLADSKVLREPALVIWKVLMQTKLDLLNEVLVYKTPKGETIDLRANGFDLLMHDAHSFLFWLGDEGTQATINNVFDEHLKKVWLASQVGERRATLDTAKQIESRRSARITRRERKVTADVTNHAKIDNFRDKHLRKSLHQEQENFKQKRQLESDRIQFVAKLWDSLKDQLTRERAVWGPATLHPLEKWQMDPTEGPYRMRKKMERNKDFYVRYPYYEPSYFEEITRKQGIPPPTSADSEAYYNMIKDEGKPTNDYFIKPQTRSVTPLIAAAPENTESPDSKGEVVNGAPSSPSRAASPLISPLPLPDRSSLEIKSPEYTLNIIDNLVPEESNPISPSSFSSASASLASTPLSLSPPPSSPNSLIEDTDENVKDMGSDDELDDDEPSSGVSTAIPEDASVKDATEQIVEEEEQEEVGLRIKRRLEPGELIQSSVNCASVDGLDKIDGILLFCTSNLYVIDGYCKNPKGDDIIEVEEKINSEWALDGNSNATKKLSHNSRKWAFEDIKEILKRRYLLRNVAIEIFSSDGRNHLVVFSDVAVRDEVFQKLSAIIAISASADSGQGGPSNDSVEFGVKDKLTSMIGKKSQILTQKWVSGQISNFQYLMHLNTLAGRSYNDLTQYPVFPWVLQDYESNELDFSNPNIYRDLSKPMGALTEPRAEKFRERFENWIEASEEEDGKIIPKFHYGTHYSSAAIVLYFLIRLEPFTQHHLKLQGGRWDQADRLFHSIGETWFTSSAGSTGSVMELIPEFYYLSDFLENKNHFNLGERQTTQEPLADVVLPNWAHGSAREFIRKHRLALESEYVSEHLHEWIDLIFGYKQQGKSAEDALNVFYYLTYEGAVDIDAITDPVQKAATIAQINNFGQTPKQLFDKPHPKRSHPSYFKPFYLHVPIYAMISKEIGEPVGHIRTAGDKLYTMGFNKLPLPPTFSRHISWGLPDGSIRMWQGDKLVHILENSHNGKITCMAASEDGKVIVSGGVDTVVSVYKVRKNDFQLMKRLCGHTKSVTCVAVSRAYSVIVSGSEDLSCIMWDLNTLGYVRQLSGRHESAVTAAAVHEVSGEILTCSANTVNVWSINGDLLLSAKTSQNPLDFITCCVWSKGPEWVYESVLISGHKDGKIKVWTCTPALKNSTSTNNNTNNNNTPLSMTMTQKTQLTNGLHTSAITALSLSTESQRLYSGDTEGRIVCWAETDLSSKPSRTLPMFNPTDFIHMIKKRGDDLVP